MRARSQKSESTFSSRSRTFFQDCGFEGVCNVDVQGVVPWVHCNGRLEHGRACSDGDKDGCDEAHISLFFVEVDEDSKTSYASVATVHPRLN